MRKPIVLLCATLFALRVATSVAQAQFPGYADPYAPEPAYLSVVEQLFPAHPPEISAFNRPPAYIGTFAFDFLLLSRSHVDSFNLVTVDGTLAQDTRNFSFGASGAIRFTAEIPSPCGVDLQVSYLSSHEFNKTKTFTGAVVRDRLFNQENTSTGVKITYEAPLDSIEVNLRARQWERFAPLAGLRIVQLDELSLHVDPTNGDTDRGVARNRLLGMQFGGEWLVGQVGPWRLETHLKVGCYYNTMTVEGAGNGGIFQRRFSTTSFLGEVNIMAAYQFTPNSHIRIGYQGLWVEGSASVYDQFDNFNLTTGNGGVDLGSINFQGGYLGCDVTW